MDPYNGRRVAAPDLVKSTEMDEERKVVVVGEEREREREVMGGGGGGGRTRAVRYV